jgi:alpha-N-arabinofuranosidase
MPDTTLTIHQDTPIGVISPRLYGHFAEHLGRCCYDGLWVGQQNSQIPQRNGFRTDVLEALRALPVPLLRWPGGCYADHYHWRDGIGPAAERPIRLGMSCGLQVEDDNSLGTHEFLWLCAQIGAEPYLAGNVGSGTPQELCDWLEYCNTSVPTTLGRERAANGALQPFGVKIWGVGNENWGCGGNYDAATYAREYVRYATMLRHVDPRAELVVCGHEKNWNIELLATIGRHMNTVDHISIHRYWIRGGPEIEFGEDEYYTLLAEAEATEAFVQETTEILRDATGGKRKIGIALDEWGVWHAEAREWGPQPANAKPRQPTTYEQAGTQRDALATAVALEGFHRQCNVLSMANLAQIVNVLHAPVMTDGARMWLTPTYHTLRMHTPHIGATALPVEVAAAHSLPDGTSAVSATASRNNGALAVTITNRHIGREASVRIACGDAHERVHGELLASDSPRAVNSAETPDHVAPAALAVARDGDGWRVELPPHSLATIVWG